MRVEESSEAGTSGRGKSAPMAFSFSSPSIFAVVVRRRVLWRKGSAGVTIRGHQGEGRAVCRVESNILVRLLLLTLALFSEFAAWHRWKAHR